MKEHRILSTTFIALLALPQGATADPLTAGDQIGIDPGPQPTENWNNITSDNAGVEVGQVVNLAGGIVDGVSIATSNSQFTNNDGSDNWVGLSSEGGSAPPEFVDSVVTDISGNFNLGDEVPYTVTVSGLSSDFTYELVAVTTARFARIDTVSVNGGEGSPVSRPDAQASGLFHSLSGLEVNESGQLVIEVVDGAATANPILNGVLITVIGTTQAEPIVVEIAQGPPGTDTLDFTWSSQSGRVYDLLASTDLSMPVANWQVFNDGVADYENFPSEGETTTLIGVPVVGDSRFFAIREKTAP